MGDRLSPVLPARPPRTPPPRRRPTPSRPWCSVRAGQQPSFPVGMLGKGPRQRSRPQDESGAGLGPGAVGRHCAAPQRDAVGRHCATPQRDAGRRTRSVSVPRPCCLPTAPESRLWVRLPRREGAALEPAWASTPGTGGGPPSGPTPSLESLSRRWLALQSCGRTARCQPRRWPTFCQAHGNVGQRLLTGPAARVNRRKHKSPRGPGGPCPSPVVPLPLPPPACHKAGREGPVPPPSPSRVSAP